MSDTSNLEKLWWAIWERILAGDRVILIKIDNNPKWNFGFSGFYPKNVEKPDGKS